jgi:hypothetical protein
MPCEVQHSLPTAAVNDPHQNNWPKHDITCIKHNANRQPSKTSGTSVESWQQLYHVRHFPPSEPWIGDTFPEGSGPPNQPQPNENQQRATNMQLPKNGAVCVIQQSFIQQLSNQ